MKVFLDANILYSASRTGSLMEVFILRLMREAECCTNLFAIEEARRNLEANERDCLDNFQALMARVLTVGEMAVLPQIALKEKDEPILAGAIGGRCSHLLTGDRRDFGRFFGKTIGGVKIVSPEMLADEIGLPRAQP